MAHDEFCGNTRFIGGFKSTLETVNQNMLLAEIETLE